MSLGARTCYSSEEKADYGKEKDVDLMQRLLNVHHHGSVAEHIVFSYRINGLSRAALQELSRHRLQSLSVKSTRYTLHKELKGEQEFLYGKDESLKRASKYLVMTGDAQVDWASVQALEMVRRLLNRDEKGGKSVNDKVKYALPESFKTSLVTTWNLRSFQNFYRLRSDKAALWEMQELADKMLKVLPKELQKLVKGD
jgi:thymidylate synthase (FAD)